MEQREIDAAASEIRYRADSGPEKALTSAEAVMLGGMKDAARQAFSICQQSAEAWLQRSTLANFRRWMPFTALRMLASMFGAASEFLPPPS